MEPVHVDDFLAHHTAYRFPYPTCFCPVLLGSPQDIQCLIRVSPYKSVENRLTAICAEETCGYSGMCYLAVSWSLTNEFAANLVFRSGGLVQYYPLRGMRHYTERTTTNIVCLVTRNTLLPRAFNIPADAAARMPLAQFASSLPKSLGAAKGYPCKSLQKQDEPVFSLHFKQLGCASSPFSTPLQSAMDRASQHCFTG